MNNKLREIEILIKDMEEAGQRKAEGLALLGKGVTSCPICGVDLLRIASKFREIIDTSKTPISEEILAGDIQHKFLMSGDIIEQANNIAKYINENYTPKVDIAKEDVNKTDEKLTFKNWYYEGDELVVTKGKWIVERCKRSAVSDKANIRPDKEETELDAEDQEYLQEWLQQKLSYYGLTPNQREKFAMKIMNIFRPYLRNYTGTTQAATQVKQNIERNALIDFMDWFNNNGDRVSDGSEIKSPDVEEYLKEKGIK